MEQDDIDLYSKDLVRIAENVMSMKDLFIVTTMSAQAKSLILNKIDNIIEDLVNTNNQMRGVF